MPKQQLERRNPVRGRRHQQIGKQPIIRDDAVKMHPVPHLPVRGGEKHQGDQYLIASANGAIAGCALTVPAW